MSTKRNIARRSANGKPIYVSMPNAVLSAPLIQHRGQHHAGRVTPSEFAILACLLANARLEDANADRQTALGSGRAHIRTHRQELDEYAREVRATKIHNKKAKRAGLETKLIPKRPDHLHASVEEAGADKYGKEYKGSRKQSSGNVTIQMTYYQIREQARLDRTKYPLQIEAALARLQRPVGTLGPVVLDVEGDEITINSEWLVTENSTKIPLRMPRTATALQLFLLLRSLTTNRASSLLRGWSNVPSLCRRAGLPRDHASRHFQDAMDTLNKRHLKKLEPTYLKALEEAHVYLPAAWEAKSSKRGVQLFAIQRRAPVVVEDVVEHSVRVKREEPEFEVNWEDAE
jgi:hypothetical protein